MSQVRIEQYGPAGTDGRDNLAMPAFPMTADAVVLASGASAAATATALDPKTRVLKIRCEGADARVAVLVARGTQAAVAALLTADTKGAALDTGEVHSFALPEQWWNRADVRVAVMDRA